MKEAGSYKYKFQFDITTINKQNKPRDSMMHQTQVNIISYINQPCPLCLLPYDTVLQIPMMVCPHQHVTCKPCYQGMLKEGKLLACSVCRAQIVQDNVSKLRLLYHAIEITNENKYRARKNQRQILRRNQQNNPENHDQQELNVRLRLRQRENQLHSLQGNILKQAIAQFKEQAITRCIATCKIILQNNPQQLAQSIGLGSKEEQKGCYDGKVLEWFNQKFRYRNISCYDLLGLCFLIEDKFDEQKLWYEQMSKEDQQNSNILFGLAVTYHNKGDLQKAKQLYTKITLIQPDYSKAYQMLGFICIQYRDYKKMVQHAQKSLNLNPNNIYASFLLATSYFIQKDYQKCEKVVKDILDKKPDYVRALCLQGRNLINQRKYELALQCFEKCIKSNPHFRIPILCKGKCLVELKDFKKAIEVLEVYKTHNDTQIDQCYFLLGTAYLKLKDKKIAEQHLLKCIQLNSVHEQAYFQLGQIYGSFRDYEKAVKMYEKQFDISPNHTKAHQCMVICYYRLQIYPKAIEQCNNLLKKESIAKIHLILAQIYLKTKDYEKSLQKYYECLDFSLPKCTIYEKIIEIYQIQKDYRKLAEQATKWLLSGYDNPKLWKRISEFYLYVSKDIEREKNNPRMDIEKQ